jgi:hypothetical protein
MLSEEINEMADHQRQMEEEPPINKAFEDIVAIAGGDPEHEAMIINAVMLLCCEQLCRSIGRGRCRDYLHSMDDFVRDAQPMRPWRD